jgi:hypothetical protein
MLFKRHALFLIESLNDFLLAQSPFLVLHPLLK